MAIETSNKGSSVYANYLNFFGSKEPSKLLTIADASATAEKVRIDIVEPVRRLAAVRSDSKVAADLSKAAQDAYLSISAIANSMRKANINSVFEAKQNKANETDHAELSKPGYVKR